MTIKKVAKKKASKKRAVKKKVVSIDQVIEAVAAQSAICPPCKAAVINYNAAMRSLSAINKKVIAFTGRFEKSVSNMEKAKTPKQKELAKKRLADSRQARMSVVAEAKEKSKAAADAEKVLRGLATLYNSSYEKFKKEFSRNAAAKVKTLAPKRTRKKVSRKKVARK
jgi:hypothetical protein